MSWFRDLRDKGKQLLHHDEEHSKNSSTSQASAPPAWTPAPEQPHRLGLYNEATDDEYASAEAFCARYPQEAPRLLSSDMVERIEAEGTKAWTIEWPHSSSRFVGHIRDGGEKGAPGVVKVITEEKCGDVCLFSNLPIMAGLYDLQGKSGVYYEIIVHKMDGIIAIGTACRPYPNWRFPGWNRSSAGLHLDDMRKFFEDPDGGRDYAPQLTRISPGDSIGVGYDFAATSIFYTYNGERLPDAFKGVYIPRTQFDVYAAIGAEAACEFDVNFGAELFRWKEGNEWAWRIEGHVGRMAGSSSVGAGDELPSDDEVRRG